jgi:UDP:flavonoid glycosyltransferase YjiC (YdhE family)
LQLQGCAVRLVTLAPFRELVTGLGLGFSPVNDPLTALKSSGYWHSWQSSTTALPRKLWALRQLLRLCDEPFMHMLDECLEGCSGSDVVLSAITGFGGPHIARKLGAPFCWAYLQPETPTRCFPHYLSPWSRSFWGSLNRATYSAAQWGFEMLFGSAISRWRGKNLRLPRSSGDEAMLVLYGFSNFVIPRPPDWDERTHVTGYWFLNPPAPWSPPPELQNFLAEGPVPFAVCLASIKGWPDAVDVVIRATRKTGQRAVILGGQAARQDRPCNHAMLIDFAPYEWLFPRVTAVLHHGGAGTAAAALRAGRPSIVAPSFFDQSFWANRMHRLGVAAAPLPPHRLSVENLAAALALLVDHPEYARHAARLGEKISAEDGAASAAGILLRHLGWRGKLYHDGQTGGPLGKSLWHSRS